MQADRLPKPPAPYEEHVGMSRQYWRDIILGVNDGLVSMLLLVAGVVGGGLSTRQVILTGVAGAVAGAISMAFGEFLATRSQDQVLQSELALEEVHIREHRQMEVDQLYGMFGDMGLDGDDLESAVRLFSESDDRLFNTMKALEFGVIDSERRSPWTAMFMSGCLFLAGSLGPVGPFFFATSTSVGLAWAAGLTAIGLFIVGAVKSMVTRSSAVVAGLENLVVAGIGGAIAFGIGRLFGNGGL